MVLGREFKRGEFLQTFQQRFAAYFNGGRQRDENYQWLMTHMAEIESTLGASGWMNWKPPGYAPGTTIPVRTVPQALANLSSAEHSLFDDTNNFWARMVEDTILLNVGITQKRIATAQREAKSPLAWLRGGIHFVAMFPFLLLQWLNLLSPAKVQAIEESYFTKLLQGIVFFGGVAAAIIQIAGAWDKVRAFF